MKLFIPFEDDWDAFANARPEDLIPFRRGMLDTRESASQRTLPMSPAISSSSPIPAPIRRAVPAGNSST